MRRHTKSAHSVSSIFLLRALAEQKMRQVQNSLHWHAADKPDISTSRSEINSVDRHLKIGRAILAVHPSRPQQPKTLVVRLTEIAPFSVRIPSLYQWLRKMRKGPLVYPA